MKLPIAKLSNLFMRGISLGAKFIFALYISKFLEVDEYGEYNLLVTTVTFLMFVIGLDFYSYTAREILAITGTKRFNYIRNQFLFHIFTYVVFLPIVYFVSIKFLDQHLFWPLYALLLVEHFSQELYRVFVFHDKQLVANVLLFFRTFFWISLISIYVLILKYDRFSIELIMKFWLFGSLLSCLIGLVLLIKEYSLSLKELLTLSDFNFDAVKKGLIICLPIFVGTISYKLIEYSDRFIIDIVLGKTELGVYSLYCNFANITNIIVNTIVTLMIFPKLVAAAKKEDLTLFSQYKSQLGKELVLVTIGTSFLLCVFIFPALSWIGNEIYSKYIIGFFLLVISNIFLNLSFLPHYLLYSFNQDKKNIFPTLIAMIANILLNFILLLIFENLVGAAVATLVSFTILYFMKNRNWKKFKRKNQFLKNG
jgi:O-antigen/teichoic acid export membrane protein